MISSILFISAYDNFSAIFSGRTIAGFSHGIVYITTITHAAENVIKEIRGRVLSVINYMVVTSIFASTAITSSISSDHVDIADMYIGISSITFVLLGLIFTPFLTYESIPFLLKKGLDQEALKTMMKLRNETFETWTIRNDFQEIKQMISTEEYRSYSIISTRNMKPLVLMLGTRVLSFLTNNIILNTIMLTLTQKSVTENLAGFFLTGARFIIAVVPLLTMDIFRRKKLLTVTGALSGSVLLIYAVLVSGFQLDKSSVWLSAVVFIIFQVIVSLGIDPLQHILLSETFSTTTRSYSTITVVTTIESILQILAIVFVHSLNYTDIVLYSFIFGTATGILLLHLALEFFLPETVGLSLRQVKLKFHENDSVDNDRSELS